VPENLRGEVKQALIRIGYPVEDLAGYTAGAALALQLRDATRNGNPFSLRPYQSEAADVFHAGGTEKGGSGVIVLPCGAGKTVVGIARAAPPADAVPDPHHEHDRACASGAPSCWTRPRWATSR